jgi:hypothetical protein
MADGQRSVIDFHESLRKEDPSSNRYWDAVPALIHNLTKTRAERRVSSFCRRFISIHIVIKTDEKGGINDYRSWIRSHITYVG